jgi:predicted transcriptional regulator
MRADMPERAGHSGGEPVRRAAGELEAAVLAVLQAAGSPLSPAEVRDRLGGDLAYTTVVTILSRLHDKGVLDRRKAGRSFRYAPADDQAGLAARRMTRMLDAEPDREGVLARFVSALSGADEDLLRRVLGEGAQGAGSGTDGTDAPSRLPSPSRAAAGRGGGHAAG